MNPYFVYCNIKETKSPFFLSLDVESHITWTSHSGEDRFLKKRGRLINKANLHAETLQEKRVRGTMVCGFSPLASFYEGDRSV